MQNKPPSREANPKCGITRLICVRQKKTLILRETEVFVNSKLYLGSFQTLALRLFLYLACPWLVCRTVQSSS